jgi:hypothetical protein
MTRIIIESPFSASAGTKSVEGNIEYARACCLDAVMREEVPFASHLFFTQFLDDNNPDHRIIGTSMGFDFWERADLVVFYTDYGWSNGMKDALVKAVSEDKPFEKRVLGDNKSRVLGELAKLDKSPAKVQLPPGTIVPVTGPAGVDEAIELPSPDATDTNQRPATGTTLGSTARCRL